MSSGVDTLQRQWQMLRLIPRQPRKIAGGELTKRLEGLGYVVTKRTVERDLQALSGYFPLVADTRVKPFGWSWQRGAAALDVPALNPTEALSFLMLRQFLEQLMPGSMLKQMAPYFGMAEQCLAAQGKQSPARNWLQRIAVVPSWQQLMPPVIDEGVLSVVQEALLLGRQLRVRYQRRGERSASEYVVHPLGLVQRGSVLYLIATMFDYDGIRLLVLHRIRESELLDEPARRPTDFDLATYVRAGHLDFGGDGHIGVHLRFNREAGAHLWDTPLTSDQRIVDLPDGSVEVRASVADTPQLRWWLLGFADGVEVIEPESLRAEMASRLNKASELYRRQS